MASAEAALITGDDDKACRIQDALTVDRGSPYWLRLRAFCQLKAGQTDAAQLTFQLAQSATKDADYARLMGAALAGTPPGLANLKTGVNYALSRRLNLDIQTAGAMASASPALKPPPRLRMSPSCVRPSRCPPSSTPPRPRSPRSRPWPAAARPFRIRCCWPARPWRPATSPAPRPSAPIWCRTAFPAPIPPT
jgi:hypothetical protein